MQHHQSTQTQKAARSATLCLLATGYLLLATSYCQGQDAQFLQALRQRRMFSLAEEEARRLLARDDLTSRRRGELVARLSQVLADHAVHSDPSRRAPLWKQATDATDAFQKQFPKHPRLLLVQLQHALGTLARGELARQEAQVATSNTRAERLKAARGALATATRLLQRLERNTGEALRNVDPNRDAKGDQLSERELMSLAANIRYQLARAHRNVALCYAKKSADRIDALTQALRLLGPLADSPVVDALVWKCRIDRIRCQRLLGQTDQATESIKTLLAEKPPTVVRARAAVQQIRLALDRGRINDALMIAAKATAVGRAPAELDYATLEGYLAAARAAVKAGDKPRTRGWQQKAVALSRRIAATHGGYWSRRAAMLLGASFDGTSGGNDLVVLVAVADRLRSAGKWDEALAAYDRAAGQAIESRDADKGFELGWISAAIVQRRAGDKSATAKARSAALGDAADRYKRLALGHPKHAKASQAHLQAAWNTAQVQGATSPEYVTMLRKHVSTWPNSQTAGDAHAWLGRMHAALRHWKEAIAAYRAVALGHRQHAEAAGALAICYRKAIASRAAAKDKTREALAREAAKYFESLVTGPDGRMPRTWSAQAREAASTAASFQLVVGGSGAARAETLLRAGLTNAGDAPPAWRSRARALLVSALARQGKHAEAASELGKITAGDSTELLAMLADLGRIAEATSGKEKGEYAKLQLEAVRLLSSKREKLSPADRLQLARLSAGALASAGRRDEAMDAYAALAKANEKDGKIQEEYARALSVGDDRKSLQAALRQWRVVERGSRPTTPRWYRAKYEIAHAHERLGDRKKAARIVTLLAAIHQDLGGAIMRRKFEALLKRCRP